MKKFFIILFLGLLLFGPLGCSNQLVPDQPELVRHNRECTVVVQVNKHWWSTGVLVEPNFVLTAYHAIIAPVDTGDTSSCIIHVLASLDNKEFKTYDGIVVAADPKLDAALIMLVGDVSGNSEAAFGEGDILSSQKLYFVGGSGRFKNPSVVYRGYALQKVNLGDNVTYLANLLSLNVSRGDSGGGIYNYNGELIGIVVAKNILYDGLGYAMSAKDIRTWLLGTEWSFVLD